MTQLTIKEIAAQSGDEYGEVSGLIKMLERRGLAKAVGHKANPPGVRGKPSTIYELDGAFDFVLFEENEIAPENAPEIAEIAPETISPEIPAENAATMPA